jgi:hypothetical protein
MTPYRVRGGWLPVGALIGAVAGGIVGEVATVIYFLVESPDPFTPLTVPQLVLSLGLYGGLAGASFGIVAGLVVGAAFAVLVGAYLTPRTARRRAFVLGVLLSPVGLVVAFSLVTRDASLLTTWFEPEGWWFNISLLLASSVLGGPMAAWAAAREPGARGPRVS